MTHREWLEHLNLCFKNGKLPDINVCEPVNFGNCTLSDINVCEPFNLELNFDEIQYRSILNNTFIHRWLQGFPPLVCKQLALKR